MAVWGSLKIAVKRREEKSKVEKERYKHLNAEFQRIASRVKKAFFSDQCKEIEKKNRMGKTRDLFLLFFGILYSNGNIFPFLLRFSRLIFSQLHVRPPQTAILLFRISFPMGMVLLPVSCTMSRTSFHSSLDTLSIRSRPLNVFLTSTV